MNKNTKPSNIQRQMVYDPMHILLDCMASILCFVYPSKFQRESLLDSKLEVMWTNNGLCWQPYQRKRSFTPHFSLALNRLHLTEYLRLLAKRSAHCMPCPLAH